MTPTRQDSKANRPIGNRISFLLQTEFGEVRGYADSYRGPRCQIIRFGAEKFPEWDIGKEGKIAKDLRDAAMTCRFVSDHDDSGTELPFNQAFIEHLHFKDEFGPAWSLALRRRGLRPQDWRNERLRFGGVTEGRANQSWLDLQPL